MVQGRWKPSQNTTVDAYTKCFGIDVVGFHQRRSWFYKLRRDFLVGLQEVWLRSITAMPLAEMRRGKNKQRLFGKG